VARLPEYFNFGDKDTSLEELVLKLERMYVDLARAVNQKPDIYQRTVAGVPTDGNPGDTFLPQGSININTSSNKVEMLTNHVSPSVVTWTTLS